MSYPNRYAVPALGVFAAVSVPWRRGRGFSGDDDKIPQTTWWFGASGGLIVPIGDSGNAPSAELGYAFGDGGSDSAQLSLSLADAHTF